MDLCEFKASLVSRSSARIGSKATQRNPVLKKKKNWESGIIWVLTDLNKNLESDIRV